MTSPSKSRSTARRFKTGESVHFKPGDFLGSCEWRKANPSAVWQGIYCFSLGRCRASAYPLEPWKGRHAEADGAAPGGSVAAMWEVPGPSGMDGNLKEEPTR
jgi:hypothetical protein